MLNIQNLQTHTVYTQKENEIQIFVTKSQNAVNLVKHLKSNEYKILKIRRNENNKFHIN